MPVKEVNLPDVGIVKIYKRRNIRSIRMSLQADNYIRVTLPKWLPYKAGVEFVKANRAWIDKNKRPKTVFENNQLVGKRHRLTFVETPRSSAACRITDNSIKVSYPASSSYKDHHIQEIARKAILRALRKEAQEFLPVRLKQLSLKTGLTYNNSSLKRLKSRWGSCSPSKDITLNIFLVQLPWELIDYVIVHELIHTKVLSHGTDFWQEFERHYTEPKKYRQRLRAYHPAL